MVRFLLALFFHPYSTFCLVSQSFFGSSRIDKIRTAKEQIASKAEKLKNHLNTVIETTHDLNEIMLVAWKDELGQRAWSEEKEMFVRKYDAEEKIVATEMEEAVRGFLPSQSKTIPTSQNFSSRLKNKPRMQPRLHRRETMNLLLSQCSLFPYS